MSYYIGIDIGTTHIKTGVFDEYCNLIKLFKSGTPVNNDENGDCYIPDILFGIVEVQLQEALKIFADIKGIGITGMAEAGLMLHKETMGELTPIIPWYDKRTLSYSEILTEEDEHKLFLKTGLRNSYKYGIYKYLWCLDNVLIDKKETIWLSVCDYVYYRLTGVVCTEPTFAARTYVYDIFNNEWDKERLEQLGLSIGNFPIIIPSGVYFGFLTDTKIPVALCGHDHICSAFGVLQNKTQLCNSCGTAETYVGIFSEPFDKKIDSGLVYGPFVDGKQYFGMANLSSSGQSLEWMRKQVQDHTMSYQRVNELLEELPNYIGEILFFPYLSGMGSPMFNASSTGAILGLKAKHTIADLLRAVIEGVSYQSKWILQSGFPDNIAEIISMGGSTESNWWMQCKANILNRKIMITNISEGTLVGAVTLMTNKNEQPFTKIEIEKDFFIPDVKKSIDYEKIFVEKFVPYAKIINEFDF